MSGQPGMELGPPLSSYPLRCFISEPAEANKGGNARVLRSKEGQASPGVSDISSYIK